MVSHTTGPNVPVNAPRSGTGCTRTTGPRTTFHATGQTNADVLTFGETMIALRGSGPLKLGGTMDVSIAGAESNVAIGLVRLGHAVRWAGIVGDDEAGRLVLRTLRAEGVDISAASSHPNAPTGLILFEPRLPDVTRVHYYRAGSAGSRLTPDVLDRAFAATAPQVLHLTGITPALSPIARAASAHALHLAREHGTLVCLDVNHRSRLWTADQASAVLRDWIPYVDVLISSADELALCLPPGSPPGITAQARQLLAAGVTEVVVTLGPDGATSYTRPEPRPTTPPEPRPANLPTGTHPTADMRAASKAQPAEGAGGPRYADDGSLHQPAVPVRAVDAVGAGDAFVAGYLSALLDGEDIAGRLGRAVTTGAFAVASPGDWEGAPTRAELHLLGAPPGTVVR
ncbi:sugar kinase [Streptomyces rimosus]|uniref:sugar kinase n=1 Tax=Streptomyces rimosus TaxID=1927 RepID=UPI000B1025E3|nr:sugar kinase [Streptomyces rimosus]